MDERAYHDVVARLSDEIIDADPLVSAIDAEKPTLAVLSEVKVGMASEAAALYADRRASQRAGRLDVGQLASRRIDALMKLATLELEIAKLGSTDVNLHGERMGLIETMFTEMVAKVAEDVLPADVAERLIESYRRHIEGWRSRSDAE